VHFDLKAQNVLLTATGDAKIADVGLARACAASYVNRTDGAIGTLSHR
jgi:serine/threonine protein kinase